MLKSRPAQMLLLRNLRGIPPNSKSPLHVLEATHEVADSDDSRDRVNSKATSRISTHLPIKPPSRRIDVDLAPSIADKNLTQADRPILRPTQGFDDKDDELSETTKLWFASFIERVESADPSLDVSKSVSPTLNAELSFNKLDGAQISDELNIEIGDTFPLPSPVDLPLKRDPLSVRSHTVAPFVNQNETLQRLVDLGIDLSELESKHNAMDLLLKLDWQKDVLPRIEFLFRIGVDTVQVGKYLTKNPWIFQQTLDDLHVRINYLTAKKFDQSAISDIVTKAVYWLNFPVTTIDTRLGWLQAEFALSGDEVRKVVVSAPKLITFGLGYVQIGKAWLPHLITSIEK